MEQIEGANPFSMPAAFSPAGAATAVKATRKARNNKGGLKARSAPKGYQPRPSARRALGGPKEENIEMGSAPPPKSAANIARTMRMKEMRLRSTLKRAQTALTSAEKGEEAAKVKVRRAKEAVAKAEKELERLSGNPIKASILGGPRRLGRMGSVGPVPQWLGGPGLAAAAAAAAEEGRPQENAPNPFAPGAANQMLAALGEDENDESDSDSEEEAQGAAAKPGSGKNWWAAALAEGRAGPKKKGHEDEDDEEFGGGARRRKTKKTKRRKSRARR